MAPFLLTLGAIWTESKSVLQWLEMCKPDFCENPVTMSLLALPWPPPLTGLCISLKWKSPPALLQPQEATVPVLLSLESSFQNPKRATELQYRAVRGTVSICTGLKGTLSSRVQWQGMNISPLNTRTDHMEKGRWPGGWEEE